MKPPNSPPPPGPLEAPVAMPLPHSPPHRLQAQPGQPNNKLNTLQVNITGVKNKTQLKNTLKHRGS